MIIERAKCNTNLSFCVKSLTTEKVINSPMTDVLHRLNLFIFIEI